MEWFLRSPHVLSTFSNLGLAQADGYHVNDNCNAVLELILNNILSEDKYLRTYRRSISFGQNMKKDLIPLFIHAKDDKTIELLVDILQNLTIPVECLLAVSVISKNDFGRHTIFGINNLLSSTKDAFADHRVTRVLKKFMEKNMEAKQKEKLSPEQCTNIRNSLLLLRNILYIPEDPNGLNPGYKGSHPLQKRIIWNIFSQSIDKIILKLMNIPDASDWSVAMVQVIGLLYKDQDVHNLHKHVNSWLERLSSESSQDNESNTSPDVKGSKFSSPMSTADITSDSSDTTPDPGINYSSFNNTQAYEGDNQDSIADKDRGESTKSETIPVILHGIVSEPKEEDGQSNNPKTNMVFEYSDCGYGTQVEHQESSATSSNNEQSANQNAHNSKYNIILCADDNACSDVTPDERKIKKIIKKGTTSSNNEQSANQNAHNSKYNIILCADDNACSDVTPDERKIKKIINKGTSNANVQGLSNQMPSDEDVSLILKEFTIDFLLKGYNSLVKTLHRQILTGMQQEIDTTHFFWLLTYFLKFATEIELDLKHVCDVLSYDILSFLICEGVNLCEQLELGIKFVGNDLKPLFRKLHLVVTAIRELVEAIEAYKKFSHISKEDQKLLSKLRMRLCETEELRLLPVLLLQHYNPKYHSKQYLQDLVITNHILIIFLDSVIRSPDYHGSTNIHDHVKLFATPEIMIQYGTLLEDYAHNGEFINDCTLTIMHHVGGELDSLITLFQPKILKVFTSIWKSDHSICDNWSDLIEYVINTFIKKPPALQRSTTRHLGMESFIGDDNNEQCASELKRKSPNSKTISPPKDRWTEHELSVLRWNYMQCGTSSDIIGDIINLFEEDGIIKPRNSVLQELFKQNVISKAEFENICKTDNITKIVQERDKKDTTRQDEITKLCMQLTADGHDKFLRWVQQVLLEACFAKICLRTKTDLNDTVKGEKQILNKNTSDDSPVISPVSYHSLLVDQSIPLVPWNTHQASICKNLSFLQLLHKLGFHMPADSGMLFIRIPGSWTADMLYKVAGKILPIDTTKLMFSPEDIPESGITNPECLDKCMSSDRDDPIKDSFGLEENIKQQRNRKHLATMDNNTPMKPGSSNAKDVEVEKPNWLEVVQKAHLLTRGQVPCSVNTINTNVVHDMKPDKQAVQPNKLSAHYSMLVEPEASNHSASVVSVTSVASVASLVSLATVAAVSTVGAGPTRKHERPRPATVTMELN